MWYVIQTTTGQEEILVEMMRKILSQELYRDCFYIKRECAIKQKNSWEICQKALFPGYIFIDTDFPKELYYELKNVPKLTKLLKNEEEVFLKVEEEEQNFLENIQSEGHLVRRSLVKLDEEKQIVAAEGAVGKYFEYIIKQRIRKRYVLIRQQFLGKDREIILGIRLTDDPEGKR